MSWYNEEHIDRQVWLMNNYKDLQLTSEEFLLVLMLEHLRRFNYRISPQIISEKFGWELEKVDDLLVSLNNKGYLILRSQGQDVVFDFNNIFKQKKSDNEQVNDIFKIFESEFARPITRDELIQINSWVNKYQYIDIVDALRYASVNEKLNFQYIDRYLINAYKKNSYEK